MKSANKLYSKYKNETLRSILRSKGLKVSGTKSILVQRLIDYETKMASRTSSLPKKTPKKTKTKKTKTKKTKTKKVAAAAPNSRLPVISEDYPHVYPRLQKVNIKASKKLPAVIMPDRKKREIVKKYLSTDEWKQNINNVKKSNPKKWKREEELYRITPSSKKIFDTLEEGFIWDSINTQTCKACRKDLPLTHYQTNVSGSSDYFNSMKLKNFRKGTRRRRTDCKTCNKAASIGIGEAKKLAKKSNLLYTAPPGTQCSVCGKTHDKMVFDHCHKKNIFRGYLCDPCNRSLGVLGDDIPSLTRAINYFMRTEGGRMKILPNGSLKWIPSSRRPSSK